MDKDKFLVRYFKAYQKFSFYENQLALIEGRNYLLIYAFFDTLVDIKSSYNVDSGDIAKSLTLLENGVNDFILCSKQKYRFIIDEYEKSKYNENDIINKYNENDIINKFNENDIINKFNEKASKLFDEFVIAYTNITKHKNTNIIEEPLIEFNNFLAHFLNHIKDEKCSVGESHLFRGCLDIYKDIILDNRLILLSNIDIINKFLKLRIEEAKRVGKVLNDSYIDILNNYKEIAVEFITINTFCKKDLH